MLLRRGSKTLALLLVAHALGCGDPAPLYTLQQVMYQVDYLDKAVAAALARPDGAAEALAKAEELARWTKDPAVEAYTGTRKFSGDPASFARQRADFDAALERLLAALRGSQLEPARAAHAGLRAACDACHAEFRPQLLLPAR